MHGLGLFQFSTLARTARPKMLCMSKEGLHAEGFLSFEHKVHSPTDLVGDDGEGFSLAVFADQAAVVLLGLFVSPEELTGRFGKCPLEVDVAELTVLGAKLLAS